MRLMRVHHERITLVRPAMRSTWVRIVPLLNLKACNGTWQKWLYCYSSCFYPFVLCFACCFAFWLHTQFCAENLDWPQAVSRGPGWLALVDVDSILQSVDSNHSWYPTRRRKNSMNNLIIWRSIALLEKYDRAILQVHFDTDKIPPISLQGHVKTGKAEFRAVKVGPEK